MELALGGFYVGSQLPAANRHGTEAALIDPRLPIAAGHPSWNGETIGYWPSYATLSPEHRAGYLQWLAAGARAPDAPLGFVFLRFYGLERRWFVDRTKEAEFTVGSEHSAIQSELERLLELYGEQSRSFRNYATNLLEALQLCTPSGTEDETPPAPELDQRGGLTSRIKIALGRASSEHGVITAPWALAWFLRHPERKLRTPATRCFDHFTELFQLRFAAKFPAGMKQAPNKTKLRAEYQPASAGFGGAIDLPVPDLPDLTRLNKPMRTLQAIADECMDALDSYSRFIGRNPEAADSLAALGTLPAERSWNNSVNLQVDANPDLAPLHEDTDTGEDDDELATLKL